MASNLSQPYRVDWVDKPSSFDDLNRRLARTFANSDQMFQELYAKVGRITTIKGDAGSQGAHGTPGMAGDDGPEGPMGMMVISPYGTLQTPANGGTGTSTIFTAGSVVFAGAVGKYTQDNANLFFDDTNNALGIGTIPSSAELDIGAPGPTETRLILRSTGAGGNRIGASIALQQYNSNTGFWLFYSGSGGGDALSVTKTSITKPYLYLRGDASVVGINTTDATTGFPNPFTRLIVAGLGAGGTGDTYIGIRTNNTGADTAVAYSDGTNIAYNGFLGNSSGGAGNWCVYASAIRLIINQSGQIAIGANTSPTAALHIKAGTASASTAPLKFTSGTVLTTAEAGALEFNTDDFFATITTGAARKAFILDDGARLTSGKIPIATTNGRLINLTASAAYTPTNVTTDRAYDANATTLDELADVIGTIIADLQTKGILG